MPDRVEALRQYYSRLSVPDIPLGGRGLRAIPPNWRYPPKMEEPPRPAKIPVAEFWVKRGVVKEDPSARVEVLMCNGLAIDWWVYGRKWPSHHPEMRPEIAAAFDEAYDHPQIPGVNDVG